MDARQHLGRHDVRPHCVRQPIRHAHQHVAHVPGPETVHAVHQIDVGVDPVFGQPVHDEIVLRHKGVAEKVCHRLADAHFDGSEMPARYKDHVLLDFHTRRVHVPTRSRQLYRHVVGVQRHQPSLLQYMRKNRFLHFFNPFHFCFLSLLFFCWVFCLSFFIFCKVFFIFYFL